MSVARSASTTVRTPKDLGECAAQLRAAMRRFPSGVSIVTVCEGTEDYGITIGSLVSLSLTPPLVGVSIGHESSLYETLYRARGFAVNLLAGDQGDLAEDFARKGVRSFSGRDGLAFRRSPSGYPLLDGAVGWLDCRIQGKHEVGDHTIFVAEVLTVEDGPGENALVYLQRDYKPV
jgi:flavin reductase (DIM6/NTAB) family NADH-FMN oxidoreductase RutF